jgi:hypothetical protein
MNVIDNIGEKVCGFCDNTLMCKYCEKFDLMIPIMYVAIIILFTMGIGISTNQGSRNFGISLIVISIIASIITTIYALFKRKTISPQVEPTTTVV